MKVLLIIRTAVSFRKEIRIVLCTLLLLVAMPFVAVFTLFDLDVLAGDSSLKIYGGPASTKNTYIWGYCTFWTAQRRIEVGNPIPNNWGDANTWDDGALAVGYIVDHTPSVGAIMQTDAGKEGHVAFVEKVNPDGSWEISEMNVKGWNILSNRTMSAERANNYNFIH